MDYFPRHMTAYRERQLKYFSKISLVITAKSQWYNQSQNFPWHNMTLKNKVTSKSKTIIALEGDYNN